MSIQRSVYSSNKIMSIRQILHSNAQSGSPLEYEIYVDDMRVVPRTKNPENFDQFEEYLEDETRLVSIIIYDLEAGTCIRHQLSLEPAKAEVPNLSGIEVDRIISEKIAQERKQWHYVQMEKEKKEIEEQLAEAEAYIEKLQKTLESVKSEGVTKTMGWIEVASIITEGLIRRNPRLIAKLPYGETLAGIIEQDNKLSQSNAASQETANNKKAEPSEDTVSELHKKYISIFKNWEENFGKEDTALLMEMIQELSEKPEAIEPTLDFIKEYE